jgi:hypothetical protein
VATNDELEVSAICGTLRPGDQEMSQNQLLTIPATPETMTPATEDESQVVERFVEASRDLVPNVQVTLAKRIIRPGTNKVVCLAAKTSIPLNDDDVASVSDLALRLSDGTNVALSLSFFNDQGVEYATPLKRYVYSPTDYNKKNKSYLGLVLIGMAAAVMGVSLSLNNKPYVAFYNFATHPAAAITSKEAIKPLTALATGAPVKFGPSVPTVFKPSERSASKMSARSRQSGSHARASHSSWSSGSSGSEAHGQALVPPPPPTPWLSSFGSMPTFDAKTLGNLASPGASKVDVAKSDPLSTSAKSAKRVAASDKPSLPEKSAAPEKVAAPAKSVPMDRPTSASATQPNDDVSIIEPKTYRSRSNTSFWPSASTATQSLSAAQSTSTSAPAPGDVASLQLERIVPPSTAATVTPSKDGF